MRVLLVEDELLIRMDLEARLRRLGAEVVGASASGEESVELAAQLNPELIIMDIKLKGPMDGVEAARRILAMRECRIVFVSAYDEPDLSDLCISGSGGGAYYSKPLSTALLERILK